MKKIVLITGASGMLAKQLAQQLENDYSVRFLTRSVKKSNDFLWDIDKGFIDPKAFEDIYSIIHLAGTPVADKRWTDKRKKEIISSRVDGAKLILDELKRQNIKLESFISASASGYYGAVTSESTLDEESKKGTDYLSEVCESWESAAHLFKSEGVAKEVAIVRIGIILAKNDGAFKKIVQPIKFGVGAVLGSGKQMMPWIHIQDVCGIFKFVLDNSLSGIYNAVAPDKVNNLELNRKIATVLKKRIMIIHTPKFILQLLFGEMAIILLEGSFISSEKIKGKGYVFSFPKLDEALKNVLLDQ